MIRPEAVYNAEFFAYHIKAESRPFIIWSVNGFGLSVIDGEYYKHLIKVLTEQSDYKHILKLASSRIRERNAGDLVVYADGVRLPTRDELNKLYAGRIELNILIQEDEQ